MVKQENPNFIASKYAPNPKEVSSGLTQQQTVLVMLLSHIVLILRNGYH